MEMGDNYFVECSLYTAEKIVAERVKKLRATREDGLESIRLIDDKVKFCQENFSTLELDGNPLEIVEKYDEEMEKKFYENRKKNKKNKEGKDETPDEKMLRDREHKKVMDRLAELEFLENQNDEYRRAVEEVPVPEPFELPAEEIIELEEVEEDDSSAEQNYERLLAQPGVSQKEMESLLKFLDACDEESSDEDIDEGELEEGEKSKKELDSDDFDTEEEPEKPEEVVKVKNSEKVVEVSGTH